MTMNRSPLLETSTESSVPLTSVPMADAARLATSTSKAMPKAYPLGPPKGAMAPFLAAAASVVGSPFSSSAQPTGIGAPRLA